MMKKMISVFDTGAVANADDLQTKAFQKALDEIYFAGGGTVEVPAGKYRIGGIRIRSNTTLLLRAGAVIYGTRDVEKYGVLEDDMIEPLPEAERTDKVWEKTRKGVERDYTFLRAGGRWNHAIIRAYGAENIAIIGESGSLIDGDNSYDEIGEELYRGPHGINMHRCKNITFSGYTIANTGNWAHAIYYSENITCDRVTVKGGHDGIHLTRCENIRVLNSEFYTGDDCVAGFGNLNTLVENCICNTACSGLRFGGTNLLVQKCRFYGPAKYFFRGSLTKEEKAAGATVASSPRTNMLSVLTYYADYSVEIPLQPGNLVIRDCTVENADRFLHYNFSGNERWQLNRPLQSVRFENIKAKGISMPLTAYGDPDVPLNLELCDLDLSFSENMKGMPAIRGAHCERIRMDRVKVEGADLIVKAWSPIGMLTVDGMPAPERVIRAEEPFSCKTI